MTRAERRARMERAKQRVQRLSICWDKNDPAIVGRLAQTRRPCSCIYCHGHARAWYGPTYQERRSGGTFDPAIAEAEHYDDYYAC